jgi:hypothetical protein
MLYMCVELILDSMHKPGNSYIGHLGEYLPPCLFRFSNLKALEFDEPASFLTDARIGVCLDSVVSTIRCVPLPKLTELEVHGQLHPLLPLQWSLARGVRRRIHSTLGT